MSEPKLVLGTVYGQNQQLARIRPADLLHHMLVVGQSGSGKSFMLARLIEEIMLRTRARVVVIDPNGDFKRICDVAPDDHWARFATTFTELSGISVPVFDAQDPFRQAWYTRRFQYIIANPNQATRPVPASRLVRQSDLFIHWGFVSSDEQDFLIDLLNVDPLIKTKINLGVRACNEYLEALVAEQNLPQGYGLLEVIRVADMFMARDVNLANFPYVKALTAEDWAIVSGNLQQLYYRHLWMWWNAEALGWNGNWAAQPRRTDMLGYLLRPFSRHESADFWNGCVIGLDQAKIDDGLLAVNLALFRLWHSAQHQWRTAEMQNSPDGDKRVPTFIVVDEAHNYAPSEHRSQVQKRVTDKLIQIAAEGRKYGLYLILATQRPRKLHPHLVLECENCCLLRVQSKVEQEFLEKEFGIPHEEAGRIGKYEKGHALLHGRWMDGKQVEVKVAPARTVVGGGGVPDYWVAGPSFEASALPSPEGQAMPTQEVIAEPAATAEKEAQLPSPQVAVQGQHLASRIAEVVRQTVAESLVPVPLSALGIKIRSLFGSDVIEATQWAGWLNLSALVKSLKDPKITYSPVAEGFVYDPSRHEEPVHENVVDRVRKSHPHLAGFVNRLHYELHMPLLAPDEYSTVFRLLAEEVAQNGYEQARTARAVRDAAKVKGVQLSRPGINFILARIYSAGCDIGGQKAKSAEELGRIYAKQALSYEFNGFGIEPHEEKLMEELILGVLLKTVPKGDNTSASSSMSPPLTDQNPAASPPAPPA